MRPQRRQPHAQKAAIALALSGDGYRLPVLRKMAASKDSFIPRTSIIYSFTYGITAVYLLGKLKYRESANILLDIIKSHGVFDESGFTADELFSSPNDIRFQ